jgi:hypothetical protein
MPLPEMHGRTHCPGGSDPIPCIETKYIVCKSITGTQTLAPGNSNILWQVNYNANPECFTPLIFGGSDYYQVRILEDGLYMVTCTIELFSASVDITWQLSIYSVDNGTTGLHTFRTAYGIYNHLQGFDTADIQWMFRMDGTGGSNRKIEFQFNNFGASLTGNNAFIEVYKLGAMSMVGRDRSANPG